MLINKSRVHWPWWSPLYNCNPFGGKCPHGCRYSENGCYVDDIYHNFRKKQGAWNIRFGDADKTVALAKREIQKVPDGGWIMLSSMCDSFSARAVESGVTWRLLDEVLLPSKVGLICCTKGAYPDVYLQRMAYHRKERLYVGVTLTTIGDETYRVYEPGAASPSERLRRLKFAEGYGLRTFVSLEPDIPGFTNAVKILGHLSTALEKKPLVIYGSLNNRNRPLHPSYVAKQAPLVIRHACELGFEIVVKPEVARLLEPNRSESVCSKCGQGFSRINYDEDEDKCSDICCHELRGNCHNGGAVS